MCWVEFIDENEFRDSNASAAYSARDLSVISRQMLAEHVNKAVAHGSAEPSDLQRSVAEHHPLMDMDEFSKSENPNNNNNNNNSNNNNNNNNNTNDTNKNKNDAKNNKLISKEKPRSKPVSNEDANSDDTEELESEQPDSAAQDVSEANSVLECIERESPFSKYNHWNCISLICKSNDDLMQEQFAMQLMNCLREIWRTEGVDVLLRTYHIQAAALGAGFIETVKGAQSVHALKKRASEEKRKTSLKEILLHMHGKGNFEFELMFFFWVLKLN